MIQCQNLSVRHIQKLLFRKENTMVIINSLIIKGEFNMKKSKRVLAMLLVGAMAVLSFAGCGKKSGGDSKDDSNKSVGDAFESMTALEVSQMMGNGINLGNTMEAYGRSSYGTTANVSMYETSWGQPETTKEMIQGMKDAGFDTIRIPVSWTNMMNYEDGDYTIGQAYIDRVKEIVGWAIDADMFVIVNDHWDGGWWGMFGSATQSTVDSAWALYESMWTQLSEAFADFDSHLIFESGNEELGNRLNDKDLKITEDSGTLSVDQCYETANAINQKFVDVVRASGGNNATRFLLIAGYDTNIAKTCNDAFKMPTDTVENKLLVSVHFYDPSNYCIDGSVSKWGKKSQFDDMNKELEKMTKFTEQGYGVIIGEYGVLPSEKVTNDNLRDGTLVYTENFLSNCNKYNYVPVLWDCNGMYDRNNAKIGNDEMAKLYKDYSYASESEKYASTEELQKAAQDKMDELYAAGEEDEVIQQGQAWIMFSASDWGVSYAVGDDHPAGGTEGVITEEPIVDGEGTYTTSIDFTQTANKYASSTAFCALGIYQGEAKFPDYVITIDELLINGEKVELNDNWYTTCDGKDCTRVNIYNAWVTSMPKEARTIDGNIDGKTSTIIDPANYPQIETISITFTYGPAK